MRTLLKNGLVINVFTDEILPQNVLIEDGRIVGVGSYYTDEDADTVRDLSGKYVCPGFIDSHFHVESTQVLPFHAAKALLAHGTTSIVTDPHEIANVCGVEGIELMIQASHGLPVTNYIMLPSCVPSSPYDEPGATILAEDLRPFYGQDRVLGLAEVMDYSGVVAGKKDLLQKMKDARKAGFVVNGHAPLLTEKDLDTYIFNGVSDDHECSSFEEGAERIRKGQWVMIRQGTAARNVDELLGLFDAPYNRNCLLASDDRNALTLDKHGDIDHIIRVAVRMGKSAITGIRMATINAARYYGLRSLGAIAPGYIADIVVLEDLMGLKVLDVYKAGKLVVEQGQVLPFEAPVISQSLMEHAQSSFHIQPVTPQSFALETQGACRVIGAIPESLITENLEMLVEGPDPRRDIAKIAVLERHHGTGQAGLGYVRGMGLVEGAIASSVSHDSHNLIVCGMDDESMALAANHVIEMGGGQCVVKDGKVLADLPLPIAGLMADEPVALVGQKHQALLDAAKQLGVPQDRTPFMSLAFISLPVIPNLKITARGLVDTLSQQRVSLQVSYVD